MVYLNVSIRIFTIMGLLLFLVLKTGRRKIGELPVFDFLTIIILGNVVGADIADPEVPHLPTIFSVILIIGIQYSISYISIKNRKFGSMVTFDPTVVIQNGKFVKSNLKKLRYSIENILMYLREKGIFDLNEVEFALVEDSGNISIQKKSKYQPLTPADINISTKYKGLSYPLILDGVIHENNLEKLNLSKDWLIRQLKNNGINKIEDAFYVDINTEGKLYISREVDPGNLTKHFKI